MNRWRVMFIVLSLCVSAFAQGRAYTPKPGTAERKAIMDALRAPVEKELKKRVVFKANHLKVQDGWAFLGGVPQQPGGKAMDYRGTPYQEAIRSGAFDDNIFALLRIEGGKWKVVTYVIGATDVPYIGWDEQYKAPSAIFE
ncbi:MAG: hypothetical protein L0229_25760 [Blastocatellia bacterium]|nr:hypothetical protein [Blastocatellia bacterium]